MPKDKADTDTEDIGRARDDPYAKSSSPAGRPPRPPAANGAAFAPAPVALEPAPVDDVPKALAEILQQLTKVSTKDDIKNLATKKELADQEEHVKTWARERLARKADGEPPAPRSGEGADRAR